MSLRLLAVAFLFTSTLSGADPMGSLLGNEGVSDVAYNASTQTFTENARFVAGPNPPITILYGLTQNYLDLTGTYNTTALVDSSGTAYGGSVSLFGSSPSMGILTPTVFFTGTVQSIRYVEDFFGSIYFDTVARIDFELPQVTALLGPLDLILIHTNGAYPASTFFSNPIARTGPWAGSFDATGNHFDSSPNIGRIASSVPEPTPVELIGGALIVLAFIRAKQLCA